MMRTALFLLASAALLPAQRVPLPDDGGRLVQLFDLRKLQATGVGGGDAKPAIDAHAAAELLAPFVTPALGKGDALQPLGERWLALLGSAEQIASVERLFAAAVARRDHAIGVEIHFLKLTAATFDKLVAPHVQANAQNGAQGVLPRAKAGDFVAALTAAGSECLEASALVVRPLQRASLATKNETTYVKDFTVTKKDGAFIADPVLDTVWDGNETVLTATFLADGTMGIVCESTVQELQRPIPTFDTKIAGSTLPVTIQLPETTVVHLRQTSIVADGDVAVHAAKRDDGTYLVALVSVTARKP
jgi:hypothetical protein